MMGTWKMGRFASLFALVALLMTSIAPVTGAGALLSRSGDGKTVKSFASAARASSAKATRLRKGASRGPAEIELNVDNWDSDFEKVAGFGFETLKAAWGVRFTLTPDQTPFTLTRVAALIVPGEGPVGLTPGEAIEILILVDPTGSGDPSRARELYRQADVVKDITVEGGFFYDLTTPVTIAQGDVYIMIVDRSVDEEGTVIFYYAAASGAANTDRSFVATAAGANQGSTFVTLDELGDNSGDFVVRGIGTKAAPGTAITGGGQPVDATIPTPTNLTGVAAGTGVTLTWTAPVLPIPDFTNVDEAEPNDSPTAPQAVALNVIVSGSAESSDDGAPGGFPTADGPLDDIEDWYRITLPVAGPLQVDLTDFGNTDFDLLLYDLDGPFEPDSSVGQSGGPAGEDEQISIPVLPAGDYLVAVTAFDPDVPSNTDYTLTITAAPKVLEYNVYCGVGTVAVSAANYFATVPGDATSFVIQTSAPGTVYVVTAVTGASQSNASNEASGGACEGGATITTAKLKVRNGNATLKIKGSGFEAGTTVLVNGTALTITGTIKPAKFKATGPLPGVVRGDTVTITLIETDGGCSTFTTTVR
jgi:hypothetical protein